GETYELRPLIAAIISTPANLARLEEIRKNNLKRTGLLEGTPVEENIAIVHLSYSVHGNEAAGSESALSVLHTLAKGGPEIDRWLTNTIVIIDPSLNPDGYSRYSEWNNQVSNHPYDALPSTREHAEPWPGGRVNHYYFDLNRDWVWLTQKESRDRLQFYLQWMPHVHADMHEMYGEQSYYFAPAAEPYHPYLTEWQSDFQVEVGRNHASYFDKEGWRYFTKETFDLFYPSYGDTYPMLSGAIGMTYEQAGHSAAGRASLMQNGDTLTLADRIAHHYTTSMSTIEVASENAQNLVKEFSIYYNNSINKPTGVFKSYIISNSNHNGRVQDLTKLLDAQKIRYGTFNESSKSVKGFSYTAGASSNYTVTKGDLIIPVSQPRSLLLNVLFEQEAALADSLTYDITAWSVPMAYGLNAFASTEVIPFVNAHSFSKNNIPQGSSPYAYAIQWGSVPSSKLLASLLRKGIQARYAGSEFSIGGVQYPTGTILLMKADNRKNPQFDAIVRQTASETVVPVTAINSGFVESGKDLGSDAFNLVRIPQVLSFSGDGTSPNNVGQLWHFFEEELQYPLHLVDIKDIEGVNLNNFNVVILPEGDYALSKEFLDQVNTWTQQGGQVIAIGSAVNHFAGKEGFALNSKSPSKEEIMISEDLAHYYPEAYNSRIRKSLSSVISGAVFQTKIDQTHPLSFGIGTHYWSLKLNASSISWIPSGGNAIFLGKKPTHYGFAGKQAMERISDTLIAGREQVGAGGIVYLVDNPLFRGFWNSGKVLFSNALFF
ncbi:MAG: M14 family zinc carboxypeptidase, partial [Saprospiraceae bacterium]